MNSVDPIDPIDPIDPQPLPETLQRIQELFIDVPDSERDAWLEFLNRHVIGANGTDRRQRYSNNYLSIFVLSWTNFRGILPCNIPIFLLDMVALRRGLNLRRRAAQLGRFVGTLLNLLRFLLVFAVFLYEISRIVIACTNVVTFLESFVSDLVTYVLKNNQAVFSIRQLMESDVCLDWIGCADYAWSKRHSSGVYAKLSYLGSITYMFDLYMSSWVALMLRVVCEEPGSGSTQCKIKQSLPFYLNSVFEQYLGAGDFADAVTVGVYLMYAFWGLLLCFCVAFMMSNYLQAKAELYMGFFRLTALALWNS